MKKIGTLLFCVLCLSFYSASASAQCAASIADSVTGSNAGYTYYCFWAVGNYPAGTTYSWSFGDGTGGSGSWVSHSYTGLNTYYVVSLTVTDSSPFCTYTAYDTIYPTGGTAPCSAYFSSSNVDTLFTLFTVNTGVPPFTYLWDLPNGTTSTLPDPTYTIGSAGYYTGTVIVTDSAGCADTLVYTLSDTNNAGNGGNYCQAYFYVVPDTTTGQYTAINYSYGYNNLINYFWSFGDGDTSTQAYPTHTYAVPGFYTICLTITSANGCTSSFCDSAFYAAKNSGGPMSSFNVISKSQANGIQNVKANAGISVYPNPAQSTLSLRVNSNEQIEKSTIYNTAGQKVADFSASSLISISSLTSGMYMIEVKTNKGIFHATFIRMD